MGCLLIVSCRENYTLFDTIHDVLLFAKMNQRICIKFCYKNVKSCSSNERFVLQLQRTSSIAINSRPKFPSRRLRLSQQLKGVTFQMEKCSNRPRLNTPKDIYFLVDSDHYFKVLQCSGNVEGCSWQVAKSKTSFMNGVSVSKMPVKTLKMIHAQDHQQPTKIRKSETNYHGQSPNRSATILATKCIPNFRNPKTCSRVAKWSQQRSRTVHDMT